MVTVISDMSNAVLARCAVREIFPRTRGFVHSYSVAYQINLSNEPLIFIFNDLNLSPEF